MIWIEPILWWSWRPTMRSEDSLDHAVGRTLMARFDGVSVGVSEGWIIASDSGVSLTYRGRREPDESDEAAWRRISEEFIAEIVARRAHG